MDTTYYIYIQRNESTGEYYIGKGSCKGNPEDDRYIGSGTLFLRKYKTHKDAFKKTIIQTFKTEEEAFSAEEILIGEKYKGGEDYDGLCLNLMRGGVGSLGSGERNKEAQKRLWETEEYRNKITEMRRSDEFRKQASEKAKRKIRMTLGGETRAFKHDEILPALEAGWSLVAKSIWLHKEDYGQVLIRPQHLVLKLMRLGFVYGKNYSLETVNSHKVYEDFDLVKDFLENVSESRRPSIEEKKMLDVIKDGVVEKAPVKEIESWLRDGWDFNGKTVAIYSDEHEIHTVVIPKRAKELILDNGFIPGTKKRYAFMGVKEMRKKGII